ncbi:hypothetical protein [Treponema sp. R80B11-R83G3]
MNPEKLINCINKKCKKSVNPAFNLSICDNNYCYYHFTIDGTSYAVNRDELVKVLKWFDKFWLFIEIKFIKVDIKKEPQIKISLSVFQGNDSDSKKKQLFRAEWDDYDNPEEKHAQPHWHITSSQAIESIFEEHANIFNESEFLKELRKEKQKTLYVKNIHFAMNGDWQNSKGYIHKIEDEQQVVNWLQGMLSYLRTELENL